MPHRQNVVGGEYADSRVRQHAAPVTHARVRLARA
jgi:hypothetical protein